MEYPKINLTIEKLRALANTSLTDYSIPECRFTIEQFVPSTGGKGHFTEHNMSFSFDNMEELITIVINRANLPPESFYYVDALATKEKVTQELKRDNILPSWQDTLIATHKEPTAPIRAQVCTYIMDDVQKHLAVLRDGTTTEKFSLYAELK